jgi:hypothetical protein
MYLWNIGKAIVKAVITPSQANIRAVFSAIVGPPRSTAPSSGGGRPGPKPSPKLVAQNKPVFRSGVDNFYLKNAQPPRQAINTECANSKEDDLPDRDVFHCMKLSV